MKRYEYRHVRVDVAELAEHPFDEHLAEHGQKGFLVVAAVQEEKHGYSRVVHFVLAREIQDNA